MQEKVFGQGPQDNESAVGSYLCLHLMVLALIT